MIWKHRDVSVRSFWWVGHEADMCEDDGEDGEEDLRLSREKREYGSGKQRYCEESGSGLAAAFRTLLVLCELEGERKVGVESNRFDPMAFGTGKVFLPTNKFHATTTATPIVDDPGMYS